MKVAHNKLNLNTIRERCNLIHGDKYIIPEQEYISMYDNINVICKKHGEFKTTPKNIVRGCSCPECPSGNSPKKLTLQIINNKCKKVHGDKYIIPEQEYINIHTSIKVFCNIHKKIFPITPDNLLRGRGCPICGGHQKLTIENIRKKCDIIHKGKGYIIKDQEYIKNNIKITVNCPQHGDWLTTTKNLLDSKCGCTKCNYSKGEYKIETILNDNNISFENQKKFKDCKYLKELPFDFYLSDYNTCIEYDGIQHTKPIKRFGGEKRFENVKRNDKIKTEYCKNNNINIIRINYNDNIEEKLKELLNI